MSQLTSIVEKLSKSSPNAVFTPKSITDNEPQDIFDYLYIETEIEKHYKKLLGQHLNSKVIVFLCGSSGDGKSAIIGQNQKYFEKHYDTHIDATHSFKPDQSAVQALDEKFRDFNKSTKSLVVGINIGILLNFAREGADEHEEIKEAVQNYINTGNSSEKFLFINFENYSKFEMDQNIISSTFIHDLLDKVTQPSASNPFYLEYKNDLDKDAGTTLHNNFQLLSLEPIKKSIVELLVTVHLKYDQFLTTRSLLDFIYTLLTGSDILIHQLFEDHSNLIIENIRKEDPCLLRTAMLDNFILERKNNKEDIALNEFVTQFNDMFNEPILEADNPHLLIRTFYLFRNDNCASNYHQQFKSDFHDHTTYDFIKLLYAHEKYKIDQDKSLIRKFYSALESAILNYANKQLPHLTNKDLITLSEVHDYALCATIEFDPDWKAIEKNTKHLLHTFPCFLKVNGVAIEKTLVSLNMYKLIQAINDGYRPNKHDRNTIIIFEELIKRIIDDLKGTKKLMVVRGQDMYEFKNNDGEIEVKIHAR